jgi:hypothetical protein
MIYMDDITIQDTRFRDIMTGRGGENRVMMVLAAERQGEKNERTGNLK